MGQAARRKRDRQAAPRPGAPSKGGALVRELREALVARARAIRSGVPDDPAVERVDAATTELDALLAGDDDAIFRDSDPAVLSFLAHVGAISGTFATDVPEPDEDAARAIEDAAEQLMAFEELPLGSRLGAVANDREVGEFVAAASLALGPGWDPFDPDPYGIEDLEALTACLAIARAFLRTIDAIDDAAAEPEMLRAVDAAGLLLADASPAARELVLDDMASPAWALARAIAANGPEDAASVVRRFAPQLPVAFAAGAFGPDWAAGTSSAERFAKHAEMLASAWTALTAEEDQQAELDAEPVLATYAAGLSFASGRAGEWRVPWSRRAAPPAPAEAAE